MINENLEKVKLFCYEGFIYDFGTLFNHPIDGFCCISSMMESYINHKIKESFQEHIIDIDNSNIIFKNNIKLSINIQKLHNETYYSCSYLHKDNNKSMIWGKYTFTKDHFFEEMLKFIDKVHSLLTSIFYEQK